MFEKIFGGKMEKKEGKDTPLIDDPYEKIIKNDLGGVEIPQEIYDQGPEAVEKYQKEKKESEQE